MRSQFAHASGQRTLDSRAAQQSACSCSYQSQPLRPIRRERRGGHVARWELVEGRRPSSACGAVPANSSVRHDGVRSCRQRNDRLRCFAAADSGPDSVISGYTPANYISFSEDEKDIAVHAFVIDVDAPANVCFGIWNDWNRLVEFLDLVAQIGLDANNPDLALFQCFYRHGLLPVMEIVFVLQKTEVVPDKRIAFESVWGMPMSGSVTFKQLRSGKTRVKLEFSQSLPDLLVDLKVGVFGVQNSLMPILSENLQAFGRIAEAAARDPSSLPPREEAGERAYALFDEEADIALFEEIMDNLEFDEDEEDEGEEGGQEAEQLEQGEEDEEDEGGQRMGSRGAAATEGANTGPSVASTNMRGRGPGSGEDLPSTSSSRLGAGAAAGDSRRAAAGGRAVAGRSLSSASASWDEDAELSGAVAGQRQASTAARDAGRAAPKAAPKAAPPPRGAETAAGSQAGSGGMRKRTARSR